MLSSLEVHHEDAAVSGLMAAHPEEEEEGIIVAVVVKDLLADLLTLKSKRIDNLSIFLFSIPTT